jgi:AcrR family transcriptional regulator
MGPGKEQALGQTPAQTAGERLSRERILQAALAIVGRDGLGALSMRRLAQDLDVWPMSIYRYFHDKDELLAALAEADAEEITPPPASGPWREQMRSLLGQAKVLLERHPASLRPQLGGAASDRVRAAGIEILQEAGIEGEEAERAWEALLTHAAGAAAFGSNLDEFDYGLDRLLDGLEAKSHA